MEAAIVITKDNIPNQKGEAKLSSQLRSSSRAYLSYNQGPEDQGPVDRGKPCLDPIISTVYEKH